MMFVSNDLGTHIQDSPTEVGHQAVHSSVARYLFNLRTIEAAAAYLSHKENSVYRCQ